jgi:hypothetical protein
MYGDGINELGRRYVTMVDLTDDERKKVCDDFIERINHFDAEVEGLVRLSDKCADPYVAQVVCDRYDLQKGAYERMEKELQELRGLCKASPRDVDNLRVQASKLKNSFEKCQRLKDRFKEER